MHDARRKLTGAQTEEIKSSKYRTTALAKMYGVSPARITQIRNGRDRSRSVEYSGQDRAHRRTLDHLRESER